jgi:hypothetical protein
LGSTVAKPWRAGVSKRSAVIFGHRRSYSSSARPVYELDDFGEAMTPELRAQEERLRAGITRQNHS